jgi:hypothetical protein
MNIEKLIPKDIQKLFEEQGYTGDKPMSDIKIVCKLFNPIGAGTWWLYEHLEEDIYMAFCFLGNHHDAEIGTISINEMLELRLPLGLSIERDTHFKALEITLKEVFNEIKQR